MAFKRIAFVDKVGESRTHLYKTTRSPHNDRHPSSLSSPPQRTSKTIQLATRIRSRISNHGKENQSIIYNTSQVYHLRTRIPNGLYILSRIRQQPSDDEHSARLSAPLSATDIKSADADLSHFNRPSNLQWFSSSVYTALISKNHTVHRKLHNLPRTICPPHRREEQEDLKRFCFLRCVWKMLSRYGRSATL